MNSKTSSQATAMKPRLFVVEKTLMLDVGGVGLESWDAIRSCATFAVHVRQEVIGLLCLVLAAGCVPVMSTPKTS